MNVPQWLRETSVSLENPGQFEVDESVLAASLRDIAARYEAMERMLAALDKDALIHYGCPDCFRCRVQAVLSAARAPLEQKQTKQGERP